MRLATYNIKNGLDLHQRLRVGLLALEVESVEVVHLPVSDHRAVVAELRPGRA